MRSILFWCFKLWKTALLLSSALNFMPYSDSSKKFFDRTEIGEIEEFFSKRFRGEKQRVHNRNGISLRITSEHMRNIFPNNQYVIRLVFIDTISHDQSSAAFFYKTDLDFFVLMQFIVKTVSWSS